eukprot:COSAG01_NODE_16408_length_1238_cov_1241.645303_3_plen_48_part_00
MSHVAAAELVSWQVGEVKGLLKKYRGSEPTLLGVPPPRLTLPEMSPD